MKFAGIILAGGLSRRMGGGDKTLTTLAGRPILTHIVERLGPQVSVLVLNANGDSGRFRAWGLPVIPDTIEGHAGPLAGILAGMEWARRTHPGIADLVSAPGDVPFLPDDLVGRLTAARDAARGEIAVAASGGRTHPATALWPIRLAADLRRALVEEELRKVGDFVARFKPAIAEFSCAPFDPFFNINHPADVELAERLG